MVAASDSQGVLYNDEGLRIPKLMLHKEKTASVVGQF
ncbi:MAG: hypothetical protein ACK5AZ_22815 [Bryobacteraceae bacterium]